MTTQFNNPFEKFLIRLLIFLIWLVFFSAMCSCNPTRQASRKLQRAERLIERAKLLDPSVSITKTQKVQDTLIIERLKHDSTFIDIGDTVIIENERLKVRYIRDTITNKVYLEGECKADTIIREIEIPCETLIVKQNPLEWFGLNVWWKKLIFWICVIMFIILGVKSRI